MKDKKKQLWILTCFFLAFSISPAFAGTIDSDNIFITNDVWYSFNEDYDLTGLLSVNAQELNIEGKYVFNTTTEEGTCNITLLQLTPSKIRWEISCPSSTNWVYYKIGNFTYDKSLLIDGEFITTLTPTDNFVYYNYTGSFSTHTFELNNDTIPPIVNYVNPPSNENSYEYVTVMINYTETNLDVCKLVWNGVEEYFDNYNATHYWETKHLQQGRKYTFYAFCNDTAGHKTTTTPITVYGKQTGGGGGGIPSIPITYPTYPTYPYPHHPVSPIEPTSPVKLITTPEIVHLKIYENGNLVWKGIYKSGDKINLEQGTYDFIIEAEGYETKTARLYISGETTTNFELSQITTYNYTPIFVMVLVLVLLLAVFLYKKYK